MGLVCALFEGLVDLMAEGVGARQLVVEDVQYGGVVSCVEEADGEL